jgi:hypothetical protein
MSAAGSEMVNGTVGFNPSVILIGSGDMLVQCARS